MVEQSKVLNTPGAEKQTKRELFDALRQELEHFLVTFWLWVGHSAEVVMRLSTAATGLLILDNNGLGKEITESVERVFCRLSGREPPLFPPLSIEGQAKKEQENLTLSSKKRNFSEMSVDGGADETIDVSSSYPAMPVDHNPVPSSRQT
ncbi:hypothetical protein FCV25MIE_23142 [Fagus crenata]